MATVSKTTTDKDMDSAAVLAKAQDFQLFYVQ
jgi:hypothetical protein